MSPDDQHPSAETSADSHSASRENGQPPQHIDVVETQLDPPGYSGEPPQPEVDATVDASFAQLEICLNRLSEISPVGITQQILDLVPPASESSQRLILVEMLKFDLARAAESGQSRRLDFYWPDAGAILPHERIPFDLVLEEVHLLKSAGQRPSWEEYRQRFPDLAATIG